MHVAQLVAEQVEHADPPSRLLPVLLRLRLEKLDITRSVSVPPHFSHAGCFFRLERLVMISKAPPQSPHLYS